MCHLASMSYITHFSAAILWASLTGVAAVSEINSLAPKRFQRNCRKVIFQLNLVIDGWSISCKIVLKWMPMDLIYGKSTLVQVMAWCHQAASHYLSQCWPRSLSPYGVIRPQWVKPSTAEKAKSWVAQRTTHDWWLGGPSQFWVVRH